MADCQGLRIKLICRKSQIIQIFELLIFTVCTFISSLFFFPSVLMLGSIGFLDWGHFTKCSCNLLIGSPCNWHHDSRKRIGLYTSTPSIILIFPRAPKCGSPRGCRSVKGQFSSLSGVPSGVPSMLSNFNFTIKRDDFVVWSLTPDISTSTFSRGGRHCWTIDSFTIVEWDPESIIASDHCENRTTLRSAKYNASRCKKPFDGFYGLPPPVWCTFVLDCPGGWVKVDSLAVNLKSWCELSTLTSAWPSFLSRTEGFFPWYCLQRDVEG